MTRPRPEVAILGAGNRGGQVYAQHITALGGQVRYLVEPDKARREQIAARYGVPADQCLSDWTRFFALGRVADAVVIATPDTQHVEPALLALALGYHVLLEKPIALSEPDLDRLLDAERHSSGSVTVCHVLRHTPFFQTVRMVLDSGRLGQLVGITHAENVAHWHYAHSFVRGNWRSSPPSAPFILAKSSHDLDLLCWFAGAAPAWIMSDGALHHFRPEHRPENATDRCVDCPVMACPSDARLIYLKRPANTWPNTAVSHRGDMLGVLNALREGPYGECAYLGRNNQPDHQTALIHFHNGVQASLTVSAFTHNNTRTLKLLGSKGELRGQMELGELEFHDFGTGTVQQLSASAEGNHGGGDLGLVERWLAFVRGAAAQPTPLAESLASHRLAFAAERSRLSATVQHLGPEGSPTVGAGTGR
ncbi:Gfo/Idh/MocA family oxidoreductase [Deinococcus sonorensis]|uniref:Gfo/Idh/MocA family oxidoreductase n=2 Tax=Deinococcus sonorensis TaxID=309891 RepID=A0AAU7U9R9_9DEIO